MSNADMFMRQMLALRDQCSSMIRVIDVLAELANSTDGIETDCSHPIALRMPMTTMGHPNRFQCRQCNTMVEG
jgi:hypothetical protein